MLFRLSRILFWMAAAAAATALFGPPNLATPLTALAGIGLLVAYGSARWALLRDRRVVAGDSPDSAPARLDQHALGEIGARLDEAVAGAATSLEAAALAAAATLRAELGAREVTVHRVKAVVPPFVDLVTIGADGSAGIDHRIRLERSPLGVALREGRVAGQGSGPFAIPLCGRLGWAAVIELGPLALQADDGALQALFEALAARIAQLARSDGLTDTTLCTPPRDILTHGGASGGMPSWAQGGGCRRQYFETAVTPDPLSIAAVPVLPTRPSAPAQLDAQALERLRELDPRGENKLVERVLHAFESSVARLLPQLEAARTDGDRAGMRHVAHTLKSSSASIGALALSKHCATVETMIRENSAEDLEAPLDALAAELDAVCRTIRSMLDASS